MEAVFIESTLFEKRRGELISDEAYGLLQHSLMQNPKLGDVIQGAGGLRKIRLSLPGRGKRGGGRIIYYHLDAKQQIYLLSS